MLIRHGKVIYKWVSFFKYASLEPIFKCLKTFHNTFYTKKDNTKKNKYKDA